MKFKSNAKCGKPVESGSVYEGKIGNLNITVHHLYNGEEWYLSCNNLNISRMELKNKTLMGAINEAKEVLRNIVDGLQSDVNAFCDEEIEISKY